MKRPQTQQGLTVLEDKGKSDFINGFMGAPGQMPGNPWNAARSAPSWYADKGDPIPNGVQQYDIPYGDRKYQRVAEADLRYVQPLPPSMRIMAPQVKGSDVPGATANAAEQPGKYLMPTSDLTSRIDAAMKQNVPPPPNIPQMPVTSEARGMSTSVASPGAGPQRNVPPPQKA